MTSISELLNLLPDQIEPGQSLPDIQAIQDQINLLYRQRVVLTVFEWVIKHKKSLPLCDFSLTIHDHDRVSVYDDVAFDADMEEHLKDEMSSEIEWLAEHLDEEFDETTRLTINKLVNRMNEARWDPSLARNILASCAPVPKNESAVNWLARHETHWEAEELKTKTASNLSQNSRPRI